MTRFSEQMAAAAREIETFLETWLDGDDVDDLGGTPDRLREAMRHAVLSGGKRLRPFLTRQSAGLFGLAPERTRVAGAALELVHCYSLVHDDLPDMDNDTLRRGKPTVWAAYDPATAILTGDALLTHAFTLLSGEDCHPDPAVRLALTRCLSLRAGAPGMVGGQVLDLASEGTNPEADTIIAYQQMKTGQLIIASLEFGGLLAGAARNEINALTLCGHHAGFAFQLADDILDGTRSSAQLGKTAGKDQAQNKATLVARLGLDGAKSMLAETVDEALTALDLFGHEADPLRETIRFLASRDH